MLQKTDKARAELKPGMRSLGQRERTVLLLADGSRALSDFTPLFDGEGLRIARHLLDSGYLIHSPGFVPIAVPTKVAALAPTAPPVVSAPTPVKSVDAFEGKRSLATTRMFLFDLCERMFARRDPVRAEAIRASLRDAKDRESMVAAAREMISEIERLAGPERADSISERIAMLLPPESGG